MPSRSFNPYNSAPPPPASLPDYIIPPKSIQRISNAEAGSLIDAFLSSQDGKILTLHRLADHLQGRTQSTDNKEIEEFEYVLEEERRREGGIVQVQPDQIGGEWEDRDDDVLGGEGMPSIETDKKRARKEERRLKKEKEREKRKRDDKGDGDGKEGKEGEAEKKARKDKEHGKESKKSKEKGHKEKH